MDNRAAHSQEESPGVRPGTCSHDVLVKGAKTGNHLEHRILGWMNEEGGGKEGGMDGGME